MDETVDVVIVGSGAAAMTAAMRAKDRGLSVLMLEKARKFGGTSATSGGVVWIPQHGLAEGDDRAQIRQYLQAVMEGPVRAERLEAFLDHGAKTVNYLRSSGVNLQVIPWHDYFSEAPGARADRSLICPIYDGGVLGDDMHLMREQFTRFKLLNRYTMDFTEAFGISSRAPGWKRMLARVIGRYWIDLSMRRRTRRDRQQSLGGSLIAPMRKRLLDQGVALRLGADVKSLELRDGCVVGVQVQHRGQLRRIEARKGVIICAGGFEWNQELRNRYFTVPGDITWSSTPAHGNRGELLQAATAIGADVEFMETGWWVPTMHMPLDSVSNFEEIHQAVFDVGRPHGLCVNRNGDRFVNEGASYDRFGNAMVADQLKTGMNAPCWLVFDAQFRRKFPAGGYMPTAIMPDRKIAPSHWDQYIYKAPTIEALAQKIGLDPARLQQSVGKMNDYARTGVDAEFGRGTHAYDRTFGDPSLSPNPCLGPIGEAPFYAVPIHLGDLGTKGGLKADASARVLDRSGAPIPGLYAAGNAAGSPFGNCYPGAGGTLGPAMVFGFIAAEHIAGQVDAAQPRAHVRAVHGAAVAA